MIKCREGRPICAMLHAERDAAAALCDGLDGEIKRLQARIEKLEASEREYLILLRRWVSAWASGQGAGILTDTKEILFGPTELAASEQGDKK